MPQFTDLTGKQYNRIHVDSLHDKHAPGGSQWNVTCACGHKQVMRITGVKIGNGCQHCAIAKSNARRATHGETRGRRGTRRGDYLYEMWGGIKARTTNVDNEQYHNYGQRGIRLHPAWVDDYAAFAKYIRSELGERPVKHTLDRRDNDGNYEPGNLRWATQRQQMNNTRRNVYVTIGNETKQLREWAQEYNMPYQRIVSRYYHSGWRGVKLLLPVGADEVEAEAFKQTLKKLSLRST